MVFTTGKGGVGKTTVAAALALLASDTGRRVLLVSADGRGDVAAAFGHRPVGFKPTVVHPGVSALCIRTEESIREYLRIHLKVPVPVRMGPLARVLDFVAMAAPGVKELLTIGKVCWEVRSALEGNAGWDLVVVDAAATGHIVAQLGAHEALEELVAVSPIRSQLAWMGGILSDPTTSLCAVVTPEEMPVHETIDLVERVRRDLRVPLGPVIVNRVLPELFTTAEEAAFEGLRSARHTKALVARAGPGVGSVFDAAELAVRLRRTRAAHLDRLRQSVDLPLVYLPELFVRAGGMRVTRMVADALSDELL